jgi:hypothetical protein
MQYNTASLFRRLFGRSRSSAPAPKARRTVKLQFERLEDRTVPALITPVLTTSAGGSVVLGSGAALTESATLSGGSNPTGSITFRLYKQDGATVVDTETVAVNGNGTYSTPTGYVPGGSGVLTGTYHWTAGYSGDANNSPAGSAAPGPLTIALPDGTYTISGFDPGPGNMLLTGIPSTGMAPGTVLQVYSQANLSAILGPNGLPVTAPGLNSTYQLSVVSHFTEVVTSFISDSGDHGATALFALSPVQTNAYFEIWLHNCCTDTFNGTGFATGTKILSGTVSSLDNGFFYSQDTTACVPIDNPGTSGGTAAGKAYWNDSGTMTIVGSGNSNIGLGTMQLTSVVLNPAAFPGGQTVTSYLMRPGVGAAFMNVDPSRQFDALPNGGGFVGSIPQGVVNGYGSAQGGADRAMLEVDDYQSFTALQDKPETVVAASPTLTSAAQTAATNDGTDLTFNDQATLAGGYNPTGRITFRLYAPNGNLLYTDHVALSGGGNGTYSSSQGDNPGGYVPTFSGTYQWVATYESGDANNNSAVDQGGAAEQATLTLPGAGVAGGQTATIGFWHNSNGQTLIKSLNGGGTAGTATALAHWLATNFANLYGASSGSDFGYGNLDGKTNAQIAAYFLTLFSQSGQKTEAQVLAVALAAYATNSTLAGGTYAAGYGFTVNATGTGAATWNVGSNGAAFCVADNSTLTVLQLLQAVNNQAVNGVLYNGNTAKRNQANTVFSAINQTGDI